MKRFILVDPSFDGTTGDKWQYAVAFARSARANGYRFVLLSALKSPRLPDIDGEPIDQRPIFTFAFYEHDKIVARHSTTSAALEARNIRHAQQRERERLEAERQRAESSGDIGRCELLRRRMAAHDRQAAREAAEMERCLADDPERAMPFNRDDFGIALARELSGMALSAGDVLFFHTMTPAMMESFSEISLHLPGRATLDVDAYCLFHFGSAAPDARTFLDRYHSYSHSGTLVARLKVGCPFRRLHLLATSAVLAEECQAEWGIPVGLFHGLANMADHFRACGGEQAARAAVVLKHDELRAGCLRLAVRAGDVSHEIAHALNLAIRRLTAYGFSVDLRLLYHSKTMPLLRDIVEMLGETRATLVDVTDNDAYIAELTRATLMLLSYPPERYEKRVSAVLHDCAVMGTSCVVPAGTTMAGSDGYADLWAYDSVAALPLILLQAVRALRHTTQAERDAKVAVARSIYGQDVVRAILSSTPGPALEVVERGRFAALFMPAWGRCGSSYAMEAQLRLLQDRGYFVIQVMVMDKPVDPSQAMSYLWRMLHENSALVRGSVQRIAYATFDEMARLEATPEYLCGTAFSQFLARIASGGVHDPAVTSALQDADVAIVNHVFHGPLARRLVRCKLVLETHDIQSYQMAGWPLRNVTTGLPQALDSLLGQEMSEVARFDHVVNVAPNEHLLLSTANRRSSLITPYVVFDPSERPATMPARVSDLVERWGLSHYYLGIDQFDLLLLGDSHVANREAAEWFIEKVYLPYLQPRGRSLALAGRISDALYAKYGTIGYVFYMGFVPSVHVLRSLSRVSVLPDQRGTGISIKSLETFAAGQAFVATSRAVRGFGERLPAGFRTFDDPGAFAARAAELLDNPAQVAASREESRRAYDALASPAMFNAAWESILHDVY